MRALGTVTLLLTTSLLAPRMAGAQPASPGRDPAAAEALFDEARGLLQEKRFEEACAKLEMSQRLDPGTGTLLNLGHCYQGMGRTASAWARFREAAASAAMSGQHDREQEARSRAAALKPRLSYLTVRVAKAALGPSLVLRRDDVVIDRELWGTPLPIDPGEHAIVATADGFEPKTLKVRVEGEGTAQAVDIPALVPVPKAQPTASASADPTAPRPTVPTTETRSSGLGTQRTISLFAGGAGVIALGIGAGLAIRAKGLSDEAHSECTTAGCPQSARDKNDNAGSLADAAGVVLVAGGVALASAIVLYLTAPTPVKAGLAWRNVTLAVRF